MESVLLTNAAVVGAMMLGLWLLSLRLRDASIVDSFWGLGFALVAGVSFYTAGGYEGRKLLILLLAVVWGARLSLHIARRNRGHGEDYRYRAMRAGHGPRFWWVSAFTVFGLQGALMWLIALPLQLAQVAPQPDRLTWLDGLGVLVWLVGFVFEALGDAQLARFKADPANKGRVMSRGLWRYTRHPNYFGDALVWWGLYLVSAATPYAWWTLGSPLLMTFLLARVSGVPLLEKKLSETRPGYRDYVERTSGFVPWPPRQTN